MPYIIVAALPIETDRPARGEARIDGWMFPTEGRFGRRPGPDGPAAPEALRGGRFHGWRHPSPDGPEAMGRPENPQ